MNDRSNFRELFCAGSLTNRVWQLPLVFACCLLLFGAVVPPSHAQSTLPLQHLWEVQPNLGDIWVAGGEARSVHIEFDDLLSERASVRLDTARKICANYDRPGFGDKDQAIDRLVKALARSDESILTRRAMISAVCLLDDGRHAEELWALSREDTVADLQVQRALIRWNSPVAIPAWTKVLRSPTSSEVAKRLAVEGLGASLDLEDQQPLVDILESDSASIELRLLAATAIGSNRISGLAPLAQKYLQSKLPDRDIVAVSLLRNHTDDEAMQLVLTVHERGSSPAKRLAATCLANRSPKIAEQLAPNWIKDPDPHFRDLALQVASIGDSLKAIEVAERMLRDEEDRLRKTARRNLLELASGHRDAVDAVILRQLDGGDWRSIEQSIILICELRDTSRCKQLLGLLDHPQAEVHMHAAWALRDLSEPGPILDIMREKAEVWTDNLEKETKRFGKSEIIMLSLLLEAFGRHKHEPANEMLLKYIPKNDYKMGNLTRASAIWSIGQIKKDNDDPGLRAKFRERITDLPPEKPENYLVRFNCILALGEFGFKDSQEVIEQYSGSPPNPLGYAGIWAKEQFKKSAK